VSVVREEPPASGVVQLQLSELHERIAERCERLAAGGTN
jgi:hypothetical protein